jgi:hypothetical protein
MTDAKVLQCTLCSYSLHQEPSLLPSIVLEPAVLNKKRQTLAYEKLTGKLSVSPKDSARSKRAIAWRKRHHPPSV